MLKPLMIGNLVKSYLDQEGEWTYHSYFKHGFNLKYGENLIFIGDADLGIVPFGIHLTSADFNQLKSCLNWQQDKLSSQKECLEIGGNLLDLTSAVELEIKRPTFDSRRLNQEFFVDFQPFQRQGGLKFMEILDWSTSETFLKPNHPSSRATKTFVEKLIGRGLGLTPAGDDFIIGILAINYAQPFLPAHFPVVLKSYVKADYTTDVANSYLVAALDESFSSLVLAVLAELNSPQLARALARLSQSGSTSGNDTIMGMFWALRQIKLLQDRSK